MSVTVRRIEGITFEGDLLGGLAVQEHKQFFLLATKEEQKIYNTKRSLWNDEFRMMQKERSGEHRQEGTPTRAARMDAGQKAHIACIHKGLVKARYGDRGADDGALGRMTPGDLGILDDQSDALVVEEDIEAEIDEDVEVAPKSVLPLEGEGRSSASHTAKEMPGRGEDSPRCIIEHLPIASLVSILQL